MAYKVDIDEMIDGASHMVDLAQKKIDDGILYKKENFYRAGVEDKKWFKRLVKFLKDYKENDKLKRGWE